MTREELKQQIDEIRKDYDHTYVPWSGRLEKIMSMIDEYADSEHTRGFRECEKAYEYCNEEA